MIMTFRWFGADDPIPLKHIRQIPGVTVVVSALYDIPVGDAWPKARLERLVPDVHEACLTLSVVESIPVLEDIKFGRPTRDRLLDQHAESVQYIGERGIPML